MKLSTRRQWRSVLNVPLFAGLLLLMGLLIIPCSIVDGIRRKKP